MPDSALEFDKVSMTFPDGTNALEEIDLKVAAGEFVAIVGPSGCGKSTILRLASGLLEPSSGTVTRSDRSLGYVFQDATLLPWRTVNRNVDLFLELQGVARSTMKARSRTALELVRLDGFENHLPNQLSGGMRMRASVARSLALEPELFLFDEPFGALDEITRQSLNGEISRLFTDRHFAGLFITHSISEATFLSTRVLVMSPRPGRLIAEFSVPFPQPRTDDLRFQSDFASLCGEISAQLKESLS